MTLTGSYQGTPIVLPSGRQIGPGQSPFIVAEIGSNWKTKDDCLTAIRFAKAAGADAVKFQLYSKSELWGIPPSSADGGMVPGTMPRAWLPDLKAAADAARIEFMCTAFSVDGINAVNPFVNIHKLASAECTHLRMLERFREIGKPLFLSTGAHGSADITKSIKVLRWWADQDIAPPPATVLLYCVAAYPARMINLKRITELNKAFHLPVGFSDHSTDALTIPSQAAKLGACVIEKHVTYIDADTQDRAHSLTGDEFKTMVLNIRGENQQTGYAPEETTMVLRHNRRLIATRDIPKGECFVEGSNFGIYRSLLDETHAWSPFMISAVCGNVAVRDIRAGTGIGPGDVTPLVI